ncbi:MAG: hypothetical protein WCX88_02675 [Patescibacteria group bacterium]
MFVINRIVAANPARVAIATLVSTTAIMKMEKTEKRKETVMANKADCLCKRCGFVLVCRSPGEAAGCICKGCALFLFCRGKGKREEEEGGGVLAIR